MCNNRGAENAGHDTASDATLYDAAMMAVCSCRGKGRLHLGYYAIDSNKPLQDNHIPFTSDHKGSFLHVIM